MSFLFLVIAACSPRDATLEQAATAALNRALPPQAVVTQAPEALWNRGRPFETRLTVASAYNVPWDWTRYRAWVIERLRPDFQLKETDARSMTFSQHIGADLITLRIEKSSPPKGPEEVRATYVRSLE